MLLLVALLACDPYADVARQDTIEAYEAYLTDHADGPNGLRAQIRLEELLLAKARASMALEDWDALLARFPNGMHKDTAVKEREGSLYAVATHEASVAAWEKYLAEYPKGPAEHVRFARKAVDAVRYGQTMKVGTPTIQPVNLAQDPTGPLDGWAIDVEVTNGDRVVESFWYRVHFLGPDGASLGHRDWPLVAPLLEFPVPVPDPWTVPMQPGETRTWHWTTGNVPEGWAKQAKVVPIRVRFGGEAPSEP